MVRTEQSIHKLTGVSGSLTAHTFPVSTWMIQLLVLGEALTEGVSGAKRPKGTSQVGVRQGPSMTILDRALFISEKRDGLVASKVPAFSKTMCTS